MGSFNSEHHFNALQALMNSHSYMRDTECSFLHSSQTLYLLSRLRSSSFFKGRLFKSRRLTIHHTCHWFQGFGQLLVIDNVFEQGINEPHTVIQLKQTSLDEKHVHHVQK